MAGGDRVRESVLAHSTETRRTTLSYVALNALRHRQGFRIWDFGILRTSGVTCEGAGAEMAAIDNPVGFDRLREACQRPMMDGEPNHSKDEQVR